MSKIFPVSALLVWVVSVVVVHAQPRLEILSVEPPEWNWGSQAINLKVSNQGEYVRFVVINTTFESHGADGARQIQSRFSSYVPPNTVTTLAPVIPIPGNYGPATVKLTCHDVVDTMDIVLPDQEFMDTTFSFTIEMPETARKWVNQRLVLPPRVEQHVYFDDQYSRMMIQFIAAGVPIEEMARICGCQASYCRTVLARMRRHDLASLGETAIELNFPYISEREAEGCLPLADKAAGLLASTISENLTDYEGLLDSLVGAGVVPDDRDNLMSGTMLLYQPYIMVSAMLLWYDLGSRFVTDGNPLRVFERSDVCNAANVDFIYAVEADDSLTGHHFFALNSSRDGHGILFADHVPDLECSGNYPLRPGFAAKADFAYDENDRPEFFFFDTTIARPVLDELAKGTELIVNETLKELTDLAGQYGRKELSTAYKYWFWNLVATKTLDLLTERKILEGLGNNHFHLGSATRM